MICRVFVQYNGVVPRGEGQAGFLTALDTAAGIDCLDEEFDVTCDAADFQDALGIEAYETCIMVGRRLRVVDRHAL
uniref:Uncharacterized protein n=1 Tax=Leersia perrieri TaxID=77586 RepID=A0A0D9X8Z1_9ORYZ